MHAVSNPYSPEAGRPPAALVGRDEQRQAWDVSLQRMLAGRSAQPVVLYGLRGVGKTVLLSAFTNAATDQGWIVAQVEAGTGKPLRQMLGEALYAPLSDVARPSAGTRVMKALKTALSFKASYDTSGSWNFGLDLADTSGGGADSGVLETDLSKLIQDLSLAAEEENIGFAVLIDEAQDLQSEELAAIAAAAHAAGQKEWPFLVALAGLPSLPRILAEAKSYAERLFTYERIEHLDEQVAARALIEPAKSEGADWADDAVSYIVSETLGYPYFLQQFGQETWNAAPDPLITLHDAQLGAARGRAALDNGFFRARWDRATKAEQTYLRAMSIDGDNKSSSGEVATRMRKSANSQGPARASLIAKGLIYAPEHGVVAFTVPGMADFIQRQTQ